MSQPLTVDCPTCGAPVEWTEKSAFRPFCSDRCKLIDLGAWAADCGLSPPYFGSNAPASDVVR